TSSSTAASVAAQRVPLWVAINSASAVARAVLSADRRAERSAARASWLSGAASPICRRAAAISASASGTPAFLREIGSTVAVGMGSLLEFINPFERVARGKIVGAHGLDHIEYRVSTRLRRVAFDRGWHMGKERQVRKGRGGGGLAPRLGLIEHLAGAGDNR